MKLDNNIPIFALQCRPETYLKNFHANTMETVDVKFEWKAPLSKENKGHTQNEWDMQRKSYFLVSYKTKWE